MNEERPIAVIEKCTCQDCKEVCELDEITRCAGCDKHYCPDCIDYCHQPGDPPNGDCFCKECQGLHFASDF